MLLEYLAFAQCSVAYVPAGPPSPRPGVAPPRDSEGLGGSWGGLLPPLIAVMELRMLHGWGGAAHPRHPQPRGPHGVCVWGGCLPISGFPISPVPASPWASRYDMESAENGSPGSDKGKVLERSLEDLSKSSSSSPPQGSSKVRHLTVR